MCQLDDAWFDTLFNGFYFTVRLELTYKLRLHKLLKKLNPLGMTKKVVSVIEMTSMYAAWYSIFLPRQNNEVKLSTQGAPNGEMTCTKWGNLFLPGCRARPCRGVFFPTRTVP